MTALSRNRGYAAIGLHNPKTPTNIGSVLRAAGCYGAAMVAISGKRYQRACTDTQKAWRHMPLLHCTDLHDAIPFDCIPVAVDLISGARPLPEYQHPERAFYVFGPEDGTLGPDVLGWCRDVIYVPTAGCMNLAATANVILYDRMAKQETRRHERLPSLREMERSSSSKSY
jgi:tRNA(Leu) C34 or U34 (ribose-2'-O)-methylase TrmL